MNRFGPYTLCMTVVVCAIAATARPAQTAPCTAPDNLTRITGDRECLVARTFGRAGGSTPTLYVVLHGDTSSGGPADYHYAIAERLANAPNAVAVALLRPGYYDRAGAESSGSNNNRTDSYTAANIDEIAGAIARLKTLYTPDRLILVGHSGGAAIAGVIMGRKPRLADAALLVSCPCDITAWRAHGKRRPWPNSESPSAYVDRIPKDARIAVLSGADDDNTTDDLARSYVAALTRRGISATLEILPNADHNGAFQSPRVIETARELARGGQ